MKFNKSLVLKTVISLSATIAFVGCGSTKSCRVSKNYISNGNDAPIIFVSGKEKWRSPSAGYNIGTRNTHVLQNAAWMTLNYEKGYKYFAFHRPYAISNTKGSLINTAKEFMEKCVPSSANPFEVGQGRCGWSGRGAVEGAMIVVFKEKPHDILVYDAKEVLDYLKANDIYRNDGIEEQMVNQLCRITRKDFM